MRSILLSIFLLSAFFGSAQDCSSIKEIKESYLGHRFVEGNPVKIIGFGEVRFELVRKNMYLQVKSGREDLLSAGCELELTFESGEILSLKTKSIGHRSSYGDNSPYKFEGRFHLIISDLSLLTNDVLVTVKINSMDEVKVKPKTSKKISEYCVCFQKSFSAEEDLNLSYTSNPESRCLFTKYDSDPISGKKRKTLQAIDLGKTSKSSRKTVKLYPAMNEDLLYFELSVQSSDYCVNSESKIIIKFKSDSIIEMRNIREIDCGKGAAIRFLPNDSQRAALKENEVSFVRLHATDGYIDITEILEPSAFAQSIICLEE